MIRFAKALESDEWHLSEIQKRAFAVDVEICGDGPPGYDSMDYQIQIMGSHTYYKILEGASIIGGFYLQFQGKGKYKIVRLFIDPSCQGKGIGSMALRYIEDICTDLLVLELEVSDFSKNNQKFYENRGYVNIGKVKYSTEGFAYKYKKNLH